MFDFALNANTNIFSTNLLHDNSASAILIFCNLLISEHVLHSKAKILVCITYQITTTLPCHTVIFDMVHFIYVEGPSFDIHCNATGMQGNAMINRT